MKGILYQKRFLNRLGFVLLFCFFGVSGFFTINTANALINENFDSYTPGVDFCAVSDWFVDTGTAMVATDISQSAPNSFNGGNTIWQEIDPVAVGVGSFSYNQRTDYAYPDGVEFYLSGPTRAYYFMHLDIYDAGDMQGFTDVNWYYRNASNVRVLLASTTAMAWHTVHYEIDVLNGNAKFKIDDGDWTGWLAQYRQEAMDTVNYVAIGKNWVDDLVDNSAPPVFAITSPVSQSAQLDGDYITISGTCLDDGEARIAFTSLCIWDDNLVYDVDCVGGEFSDVFHFQGVGETFLIAVDASSTASDCVDYDDKMDVISVDGFEAVEGYPSFWAFDYNYNSRYDIEIVSPPDFDTAITLDVASTSVDVIYSFDYPRPLSPFLVFKIKQYDGNGSLLDDDYHSKQVNEMASTTSYSVNMLASTTPYHYVVQLFERESLVRQFAFGVYSSDTEWPTATGWDIFPTYDIDSACDDVASSSGTTADNFRYGMECALRKVMYWAVNPKDNTYFRLQQALLNAQEQFPISVYYQVQNTLLDVRMASTSDISVTFLPAGDDLGLTGEVFNSHMLSDTFGTVWDYFYNTLEYIIFAVGFLYFVFRIYKIARKE